MTTSRVPAALSALVARAEAVTVGASVHDGPPVQNVQDDYVCIGYTPLGDSVTAVDDWTQEVRGLGQGSREERFDVVCYIGSSSGDLSVADRRDRVFALLAALEADLRADADLGGSVRFAELTAGSYFQDVPETGEGVTVGVEFRISVQARI